MAIADTASDRIVIGITALAAVALAGLSMGWIDAGFVDLVGNLARAIAKAAGADEVTARAIEIGTEAAAKIAKLLFF